MTHVRQPVNRIISITNHCRTNLSQLLDTNFTYKHISILHYYFSQIHFLPSFTPSKNMNTKNHIHNLLPLFLVLLLGSSHVTAQDDFFGDPAETFTPSTVIIIIMAVIFTFTAFLSIFLRQFSKGCFGLSTAPPNPNVTADGRAVRRGLDAAVIKSLPTYLYSDVREHRKGSKVQLECAICLIEFLDVEALRLLPGCNHVFHPRCIDQWLLRHVTCPICRRNLETGSGVAKEHSINMPFTHESDECQRATCHNLNDGEETKRSITGNLPRSHSTGHPTANSERYTLRLSEEVHNNLVNKSSYGREALTSICSPRSGYK
ncbi:hypothetical protein RND81_01G177100 [Saponaria officinalis]|uniref:RING-type E3 ubiquitin transferase n=1 Tax=Saponaria officinalis TaxID=3572 RepID=A0AAW1NJD8_SAPOF